MALGKRSAQQLGLADVGGQNRFGDIRPGGDNTIHVSHGNRRRSQRDNQRPRPFECVRCGISRSGSDRRSQDGKNQRKQSHHRHDNEHRHPNRIAFERHPNHARNLQCIPIQVDVPPKQRGGGGVEIAAHHQQQVSRCEHANRRARQHAAPSDPTQNHPPQQHKFGG